MAKKVATKLIFSMIHTPTSGGAVQRFPFTATFMIFVAATDGLGW
jgi:hypothetical protein